MKPVRKERIKWSPELAYIVGLIATDGNLSIDGRHIEFTSKDIELVKIFKKCLHLKTKIGFKNNGTSNRKYPRIQFGDIIFYRWLLSIGLTPRKSRTISALRVPNNYFFDFLRGCFDGDGTIFSYWDRRWHSSFMFYIAFASGSLEFLRWLQNKIRVNCRLKGYIGRGGNNYAYILRYAKKESLILFNRMHYSKNIPFLKRKLKKALNIFQIDADHKLLSRPDGETGKHATLRW